MTVGVQEFAEGSVLIETGGDTRPVRRHRRIGCSCFSAWTRPWLGDGPNTPCCPGSTLTRTPRTKRDQGAHEGDPAVDRQDTSSGDGPRCAGRAHADSRLRRAAGRRRNPDCVYHRRVRGRPAGPAANLSRRVKSPVHRSGRRWLQPAWASWTARPCSTSATRRTFAPMWTLNVVMAEDGSFVEVQGSGEEAVFRPGDAGPDSGPCGSGDRRVDRTSGRGAGELIPMGETAEPLPRQVGVQRLATRTRRPLVCSRVPLGHVRRPTAFPPSR